MSEIILALIGLASIALVCFSFALFVFMNYCLYFQYMPGKTGSLAAIGKWGVNLYDSPKKAKVMAVCSIVLFLISWPAGVMMIMLCAQLFRANKRLGGNATVGGF